MVGWNHLLSTSQHPRFWDAVWRQVSVPYKRFCSGLSHRAKATRPQTAAAAVASGRTFWIAATPLFLTSEMAPSWSSTADTVLSLIAWCHGSDWVVLSIFPTPRSQVLVQPPPWRRRDHETPLQLPSCQVGRRPREVDFYPNMHIAQLVKDLPAMQETLARFLAWEDLLEKG